MVPFVSPKQAVDLSVETTLLWTESQAVIAMRIWGMAGFWSTADDESARMVSEKTDAFTASGLAIGRAMISGQGLGDVALAALRPLRARTSSNAKRLSEGGLSE